MSEEPVSPALLFERDGSMHVIHDLAVTSELVEDADGVYEAFDALARPMQAIGSPGAVRFVLASSESEGSEVRKRVARYYSAWVARHGHMPPEILDIREFVYAVANDEVTE
ncbi:hypothetical protein OG298_20655 [Streptomyces sp. NBC_01005]|uniref:hypothetical protein n=1 Tax=unclassified Streptomyces TaxID=2593676 RepID=UPI0032538841|nr:hypothetical protein OG298_20655 [Streptomyces sp. NBC_01005]WTC96096.1 hypothetical protein OH736_20670 [Streptomyces sp. NBC_01650]